MGRVAEFLAADMQRTYAEVCRELNWAVRPWNPVARELTRLTQAARCTAGSRVTASGTDSVCIQ